MKSTLIATVTTITTAFVSVVRIVFETSNESENCINDKLFRSFIIHSRSFFLPFSKSRSYILNLWSRYWSIIVDNNIISIRKARREKENGEMATINRDEFVEQSGRKNISLAFVPVPG